MSKLIAEEIVEAITLGDKEGFMSAFHSALAAKVSDALEIKKVEIASTLIAPASSEVVEEEVEQIYEAKYADDPAHKIASGLASKMNAESPYKNNKGDVHKHIVHSTKEGDGVTHFVTQKRDLSGDHNTPYASVTHRDNKIHWEVGNSSMKQDPSGVHSPKEAKSQLHAAIDATHKRIRTKYDMDLSPEEARAANQARVQKSRENNMKKEEVEQIDEAAKPDAKELKVSFGRGHSGQPGGEGQSDTVTTHHDNGLKVKSSIGWDGDHSIDVHHNGKHVGGIFSTHGSDSPRFEKNKKYTGEIEHKEVRTAMAAHQKHPEVQSWLIHNHSDSESEADTGTINGHKLHPTAEKYLEKITNDDNRDYEAPYKPQTKSAAKPTSASKASTSDAYKRALAALQKRHGIKEEVEEIDEAKKGETRISWRARTPEEIAKSDKRRKVKVTSAELEARARARRAEKSE